MTSNANKQMNYSTEIIVKAHFACSSNCVLFCSFPLYWTTVMFVRLYEGVCLFLESLRNAIKQSPFELDLFFIIYAYLIIIVDKLRFEFCRAFVLLSTFEKLTWRWPHGVWLNFKPSEKINYTWFFIHGHRSMGHICFCSVDIFCN